MVGVCYIDKGGRKGLSVYMGEPHPHPKTLEVGLLCYQKANSVCAKEAGPRPHEMTNNFKQCCC